MRAFSAFLAYLSCLVREEMSVTRSMSWTFEWRYGLIDANGNEIIPKKYVDAEIKSDIIKCRISGTWKYDEISIEELASKYAVDKLYHAYCQI